MRRTKAQILREKIVDAVVKQVITNNGAIRIERISDIYRAAETAHDEVVALTADLGPVEVATIVAARVKPLFDSFVKEAV